MTRRSLRRHTAVWLLVAIAPLVMSCALSSNETGTIYGYVRDSQTQLVMVGAFVECEGLWAETGSNGYYYIEGVTEGWRSVHAEASGYSDHSNAVSVSGDTRYDIAMDVSVGVSHVYGVVSRPGQGPIEGALVDLDGRTKLTDANGEYEFWNVPRNAQNLDVTLDGYRSYTTPLYLDEDDEEINVTLLLIGSVTLDAAFDATIREDIPSTNLGALATLDLFNNPSWHYRFLVIFDLSGVPGTAVAEACTLRLVNTFEGSGDDPIPTIVARVSEVWEELEVTWGDSTEFTNASYATVSFDDPVYEIDVTSRVDDWLSGYAANYGLLIDTDENPTAMRFSFASREHEQAAWRPKLIIHYAY